ncbi:hypothetical protein ACFCVY_21735 [Streptomyces sp. NPDC056411]|uniref:hypothetical protein n=1 Tax=Streptomyces sp. NPDC056411 TaxID=3345813 RepID=UPI0035DFE215
MLFQTWGEHQDHAEHDPSGGELLPLAELVDEHGADAVLTALDRIVDEAHAEVMDSTARKAQGREGPQAKIVNGFPLGAGQRRMR